MKDSFQQHLDRVSRSFALCIAQLSDPLRQWVSLSYLLCRVLDTIEDAVWADPQAQDAHYQAFEAFLFQNPTPIVLEQWIKTFPSALPEGEKLLLDDTAGLLIALTHMPPQVRTAIRNTVIRMSHGMRHYTQVKHEKGTLRLRDLKDVNRYCFFVAGIVGALLTELFDQRLQTSQHTNAQKRNALHFGLFLQKINLLKDQQEDELEGRFLIPNRQQVMASLREHAQAAFDYILSLPTTACDYRAFCAFSLFLGAQALAYFGDAESTSDRPKLSRTNTIALMQDLQNIAQENTVLTDMFQKALDYFPKANPKIALNTQVSDVDWFVALTQEMLSLEDRIAIGVN